ncbi:MAG: GntR family transcriptional regulator [Spirochaetales bacterium]|nr:GntR family transcriptional regulator [Spirochaetales bacterium]
MQEKQEQTISRQTVVAQVMSRVKNLIASGEFGPGQRLPTEQELARQFGVGRSSIREAMKVFQHLGVVQSKAAKGTFVQDRANISVEAITWALLLGDDDLKDVFDLRQAIESICFNRLAGDVERGDAESRRVLDRLNEVVQDMRHAASVRDSAALVDLDYRFHETIIEAGGNRLFIAIYHTLQAFMHREIEASYTRITDLAAVAEDHGEILAALTSSPRAGAVDRHNKHFERTQSLLGLG